MLPFNQSELFYIYLLTRYTATMHHSVGLVCFKSFKSRALVTDFWPFLRDLFEVHGPPLTQPTFLWGICQALNDRVNRKCSRYMGLCIRNSLYASNFHENKSFGLFSEESSAIFYRYTNDLVLFLCSHFHWRRKELFITQVLMQENEQMQHTL